MCISGSLSTEAVKMPELVVVIYLYVGSFSCEAFLNPRQANKRIERSRPPCSCVSVIFTKGNPFMDLHCISLMQMVMIHYNMESHCT